MGPRGPGGVSQRKEKNTKNSGHIRLSQLQQVVYTLHWDQYVK